MKKSLLIGVALMALAAIPSMPAAAADGFTAATQPYEAHATATDGAALATVSGESQFVTSYDLGFTPDVLSHSFDAVTAHVDPVAGLLVRSEEEPAIAPSPRAVHLYSTYRAKRSGVRFRKLIC